MSFVAFTNANSIGDRFLDLLSNHGIQPPLGVPFRLWVRCKPSEPRCAVHPVCFGALMNAR